MNIVEPITSTESLTDYIVDSIEHARAVEEPFYHLELDRVFPVEVYGRMLGAMPVTSDYRHMSGRSRGETNSAPTRVKIDLFPEYIRALPAEKRRVWNLVGRALCSRPVTAAFLRRLAPAIERRFGAGLRAADFYPVPILTRDIPGYSIAPHPDTHWKGITVQLYLPRDESITHIGTIFHGEGPDGALARGPQMKFAPNTGYAFAVDKNTWHSADPVGPEVDTRDSILLTYFVDQGALRMLRNRGKRIGNFILNEVRQVTG